MLLKATPGLHAGNISSVLSGGCGRWCSKHCASVIGSQKASNGSKDYIGSISKTYVRYMCRRPKASQRTHWYLPRIPYNSAFSVRVRYRVESQTTYGGTTPRISQRHAQCKRSEDLRKRTARVRCDASRRQELSCLHGERCDAESMYAAYGFATPIEYIVEPVTAFGYNQGPRARSAQRGENGTIHIRLFWSSP